MPHQQQTTGRLLLLFTNWWAGSASMQWTTFPMSVMWADRHGSATLQVSIPPSDPCSLSVGQCIATFETVPAYLDNLLDVTNDTFTQCDNSN